MAKKELEERPVNGWSALVLIVSNAMHNGQGLLVVAAVIICLALWKMSAEGVDNLVLGIARAAKEYCIVGYVLSIVLLAGWSITTHRLTKTKNAELERVVKERNELQEQLTQRKQGGSGI